MVAKIFIASSLFVLPKAKYISKLSLSTIDTDGTINKILVTSKVTIVLPATSIEDEIIYFTEISYKEYAKRISELEELACKIEIDDLDRYGEVDMKLFYQLLRIVNDIVFDMEEQNLLLGTLTRTLIEDNKIDDDGSAMYVFQIIDMLYNCFKEILDFNFAFKGIIDNLCEGYCVRNLQSNLSKII